LVLIGGQQTLNARIEDIFELELAVLNQWPLCQFMQLISGNHVGLKATMIRKHQKQQL
jgi:hypothetical protein